MPGTGVSPMDVAMRRRGEPSPPPEADVRVTHNGDRRVTEEGDVRVTEE